MYLFRLDDASDYMDVGKWDRIETLFDKYEVKPLVGIIPHNEDKKIVSRYVCDDLFWDKALKWKAKGWRIAQHGYNHSYVTKSGGINPVNMKSEFAGLPLEQQKEKIKNGFDILCSKGLKPDIFFAPSHTYDKNTIEALRLETDIRIISDTIANDVYKEEDFYYIPQQSGKPRKLPFRITTICLHPNILSENSFLALEDFLKSNRNDISNFCAVILKSRELSLFEKVLRKSYFLFRIVKSLLNKN